MVSSEKMLVEVGDQAAWKVHDALLLCTEFDIQGVTKLAMEVRQHLCQIPPTITDNCVRIMYLQEGPSSWRDVLSACLNQKDRPGNKNTECRYLQDADIYKMLVSTFQDAQEVAKRRAERPKNASGRSYDHSTSHP